MRRELTGEVVGVIRAQLSGCRCRGAALSVDHDTLACHAMHQVVVLTAFDRVLAESGVLLRRWCALGSRTQNVIDVVALVRAVS